MSDNIKDNYVVLPMSIKNKSTLMISTSTRHKFPWILLIPVQLNSNFTCNPLSLPVERTTERLPAVAGVSQHLPVVKGWQTQSPKKG